MTKRAVIVVDVQDSRLELATRLGATDVVNGRDTDVVTALRDLTGGGPEREPDSLRGIGGK